MTCHVYSIVCFIKSLYQPKSAMIGKYILVYVAIKVILQRLFELGKCPQIMWG